MKGELTVIQPDGKQTVSELSATPDLEMLQKAVGGYIEAVPYFTSYNGKSCVAFCNEEGKLNGLPVNSVAQSLWVTAFGESIFGDHLVGPIAIITGDTVLLQSL